jgi:CTP synthase
MSSVVGIQPDIIICRSDQEVPDQIRDKISLFCDVEREAVIPLPTISTVYEVPLFLEKMANFPVVNANLYIKAYNKRLMSLS